MTDLLTQLAASLTEAQEPFKVGDRITWKTGLRNKRTAGPLIVTEVLSAPVFDQEVNAGSPYFREPLTIKAVYLDDDGDLMEYHYDARRFRLA